MKKIKKTLSIFLAIIMMLTTFSVTIPVFAEENLFVNRSISNELIAQEEMTSKIVGEMDDLREECSKHFICEDGSFIVATYSVPVHYKENGRWKEINNTLELTDDIKSAREEICMRQNPEL